jgi:hypothetical protein
VYSRRKCFPSLDFFVLRCDIYGIGLDQLVGVSKMKKLLILGGIAVSASALAQAQSSPNGSGSTPDPNQTICRTSADTGSRLSRTRVCMTRAQWDDRRRETRENINRSQVNSRSDGGGG